MTKGQKRVQKILESPKTVDFETLDLLLKDFGYECKGAKGSHHKYKKTGMQTIIVPHKRPYVKEYYVRRIIEILGLEKER